MMNSTNEEDPFLQVQADVLTQLSQTRQLFTSYLRIRSLQSSSSSTPSPELLSARKDLTSALSLLADDLSDLLASVQAVQSDPYRYGLEIEEVVRRKRVVDEVSSEVEDMREEMSKTSFASQSQSQNGAKAGKNKNINGFDDSSQAGGEGQEDYAAEFEHQQQVQMLASQDEQLDSVFHTVGNLRQQASDMGRELEEQAEMLDTTDQLADRVGGRLSTGMKRMGEVVRRNEDGWSSCCIGVLIFVLIILLVLVLVL